MIDESLVRAPLTYKIFYMHKIGLRFPETEFRKMPLSRFYQYLHFCWEYNEDQKDKVDRSRPS